MAQNATINKDPLFIELDETLIVICNKHRNCNLLAWRNFWYPLSGIKESSNDPLLQRVTRIGQELFDIGGVDAMIQAAEFVGGGLERLLILDCRWGNIGKETGKGYWPPNPKQYLGK